MSTLTSAPSLASSAPSAESAARLAESLRSGTLDRTVRSRPDFGPDFGQETGPDFGPHTGSGSLRVGVDLVPVADVAASVARLGNRYLYRVFTPHERACARSGVERTAGPPTRAVDGLGDRARYSMESLAARFAAKEAAVKVLRPVGPRPEWRSIEVRRVDGGWCELRLSGTAAALAAEAGITSLAVSVTHEPMMAAACVVGMSWGDTPAWRRTSSPDRRGK
jgi:holo-[acyl-carrier protein] synthase